ncbi:glycylpeptide N-tetRadecanoyltransferase, putative [Entamoeba dispar SAW760]|uniref:Glycylpeptide N-tetradecanoyltransferase n=1 Tax=Entamoeba dispar (strain ATCC PRA-260 / SAW760) TaxID=370354 RepID=B0E5S1_ENTDS|nr:glycylpeptide N-tetRadecanoyltransferase, putative [Entamoeba dispar SAW760]EDR30127.1 glycylpeptide N-tetRadecanoyltransferase, putative [Entamoeba dispar SAW760]|eukprot:EDR30127.1 glycylpeptide N-tetRadecanoyltransferase, putative [Entamoeba dispar SAW760]
MPHQQGKGKKTTKKNNKITKKQEIEEEKVIELKPKELVKEEEKSEFLQAIKKEEDGKTIGDIDNDHKFWKYEPVTGTGVIVPQKYNNPIQPDIPIEKVPKVPAPLPNENMEYCIVNIDNEKEMEEVYILLKENYVEDDDATLRFDYQKEFIKWCLKVPGYYPSWFVGIRQKDNHELIGFITGIPSSIKIYDRIVDVAEINFLCVRKDMRKFKLAPQLIKEVTRQVHLTGLFQAVYTSGTELPNIVCTTQYFHRPLNPKKLDAIGFSTCNQRLTLQRALKLYKLPEQPNSIGFRQMEEKDVDVVTEKLNRFLHTHYDLTVLFSKEMVAHTFLSRDGIIKSYVLEQDGVIKAFGAFYILPSSILNSYEYSELYIAYQYYYFYDKDVDFKQFFKDILICAVQNHCDVFNCLNISENQHYIADLLFVPGDGYLKYYLYNWACPKVEPNKLAIILQ